ncbi:hypothetical protein C5167_039652 [Papaver somniferum]|uniref:Transposase MuDR plant domain-containing protein n=1 Tax=Papaver somniferum TaxID=3469 RepID=A0A4Y7IGV2_PAPSO|nr:hypothetical protein C5167_039652 [Papaver somniferum]
MTIKPMAGSDDRLGRRQAETGHMRRRYKSPFIKLALRTLLLYLKNECWSVREIGDSELGFLKVLRKTKAIGMSMMVGKSPLLLFRSLTTSPMRSLSSSCSPRFLSLSSNEKPPAYHRSEDDEPSIRSRLPPREKVGVSGVPSFFTIIYGEEVKVDIPPLTPKTTTGDDSGSKMLPHTPLTPLNNLESSSDEDYQSKNETAKGDGGAKAKVERNFEYTTFKSDSQGFIAKCKDKTCKWRLRAVPLDSCGWWRLTAANDVHTCGSNKRTDPELRTKAVSAGIAELFKHKFKELDAAFTPKQLVKDIKRDYHVVIWFQLIILTVPDNIICRGFISTAKGCIWRNLALISSICHMGFYLLYHVMKDAVGGLHLFAYWNKCEPASVATCRGDIFEYPTAMSAYCRDIC